MKFLATRAAVIFFVTIALFITCSLLFILMHWWPFENMIGLLQFLYFSDKARLILGILVIIMFVKTVGSYRILSLDVKPKGVLCFDNPDGRVSVSLLALEDLVKKSLMRLAEIKDSKASIKTSKRGLQANVRVALTSEYNIPEMTSKVQNLVKKKLQDTIGLEDPVDVEIYVHKILLDKDSDSKKDIDEKNEESLQKTNIPFEGYRA